MVTNSSNRFQRGTDSVVSQRQASNSMNRSQYPTELTTSRCKVIVTQRESIQIFKPHTLKAQWPSVISPLIRASTFFPALQSFPMQQLRKQSYLVLPGNRNSLASKINNWGGDETPMISAQFSNTLRPPLRVCSQARS